jgi:hypothetical protein
VNLTGTHPCSCILMWIAGASGVSVTDVWLLPNPLQTLSRSVWPQGDARWKGIRLGKPRGGDFVPRSRVGLRYRSPGYVSQLPAG